MFPIMCIVIVFLGLGFFNYMSNPVPETLYRGRLSYEDYWDVFQYRRYIGMVASVVGMLGSLVLILVTQQGV
ncbi:hypothetical protein [Vibrio phage RYC]|nr:hypothetical protein [Vibrio phage RYC]